MNSTDMLKQILDEDVRESPEEYEERLSVLTKDQLIAEMMRKKASSLYMITTFPIITTLCFA
jgi:hypothetical protein